MPLPQHLNLVPPLIQAGKYQELLETGQTLKSALSPANNSLAVYLSNVETRLQPSAVPEEQSLYFSGTDPIPSSARRLFISDTSVIFAAVQNLVAASRDKSPGWLQSDSNQSILRKLAIDYINHIKECWIHASQPTSQPEDPLQYSSDHYRSLYTCFALFVVLYLPETGLDDAPVGEDLMEWLNTHFIEPSTEEGDHLSGLERPWEDDTFWPYLTRATLRGLSKASIFFLDALSRHPSEDLQLLAKDLVPLIDSQPRLQHFSTERDYTYASRRWRDRVKTLRLALDRVPEVDRHDDFENWWDRLSDIVGALEGREDVIRKICDENGGDWKEVCIAWSIFVDVRLRRRDLPEIVGPILEDIPADPMNLEDMVHAELFHGRPEKALEYAAQLDPWLSSHMADLMNALSLIDSETDDDIEILLRDHYVLAYADYLHSDSALWRINVAYLCSCGEIGSARADEVILRVPLHLQRAAVENDSESSDDRSIRAGDVIGVLKEVNATCFEYKREEVRRTVCRIAAQTFVRDKDFGLAVSYYASAEDWAGLGRVVDRVLEEHITNGPAQFTRHVAEIAPSLQILRSQPGSPGIFIHRLMFAVRYAEFHRRRLSKNYQGAALELVAMFQEDIAPKLWWGILLCDAVELLQNSTLLFAYSEAVELLQKLEEIVMRAEQGSEDDYLTILRRTIRGGGNKEALNHLKTVRLGLARYFARCTVIGVGGKHVAEQRSYAFA